MPTITITETPSAAKLTEIVAAIEANGFLRLAEETPQEGDSAAVQVAKTAAFWKRYNRMHVKNDMNNCRREQAENTAIPADDTIFDP